MKTIFEKNFWNEFIDVNENFNQACVIENAFNENFKNSLYQGVTESFYNRVENNNLINGFRLYNDKGELVKNQNTIEIFTKNPPKENEDIILYFERIIKTRFGIIMNFGEVFSELLGKNIFQALEPLYKLVGYPPLGNEITIFIGNYGWTPLGIHKDHTGENVLHFHLGPGRKQMYIWDDETYEKLVGKNVINNKEIEPILNYAKKFDFGEGDIFYMPWFVNHVGYTEDISIGVSLWFHSSDIFSYSKKVIKHFLTQFIPNDTRIIPPQIDYLNNHDTYEYFKKNILKTLNKENPNLNDFLMSIYLDFKYSLFSNGGWANCPPENKIESIDYTYFEYKIIELSKPFKIIYNNFNNEKLDIYIRGRKTRIKYFKDFENLLNKLNNDEKIVVNDFIETLSIPKEAFLYILLTLYKHRGIVIIE